MTWPDLLAMIVVLIAGMCIVDGVRQWRRARQEQSETRTVTVKVIDLTLEPGQPFEQWCDACNRTHWFAHLYAFPDNDPTKASRITTVPLQDMDEDAEPGGGA